MDTDNTKIAADEVYAVLAAAETAAAEAVADADEAQTKADRAVYEADEARTFTAEVAADEAIREASWRDRLMIETAQAVAEALAAVEAKERGGKWQVFRW